jgi:hypothetical protein
MGGTGWSHLGMVKADLGLRPLHEALTALAVMVLA